MGIKSFFGAVVGFLVIFFAWCLRVFTRKAPASAPPADATEYTSDRAVEEHKVEAMREKRADERVELALSSTPSYAQQNADIQQWLDSKS